MGAAQAVVIPFENYQRAAADKVVRVNVPIKNADYKAPEVSDYNPTVPLTLEEYTQIKEYFLGREKYFKSMNNNMRNFLFVVLAVNLAARCGDILNLHVYDVLNGDGTIKSHVRWVQEKTKAPQTVLINSISQDAIAKYMEAQGEVDLQDWLFPNYRRPGEHITYDGARKMLQRALVDLGICQGKHIGTHSLRKTYDNVALAKNRSQQNIVFAAKHLGHRAVNDKNLLRYIGTEQADYDRYIEENGI